MIDFVYSKVATAGRCYSDESKFQHDKEEVMMKHYKFPINFYHLLPFSLFIPEAE